MSLCKFSASIFEFTTVSLPTCERVSEKLVVFFDVAVFDEDFKQELFKDNSGLEVPL